MDELLVQCQQLGVMTCNPAGPVLLSHPAVVERLHTARVQVAAWTLDLPEHWDAALASGVDAIITNRPDRLLGYLARP